jgi:hypothetical protein
LAGLVTSNDVAAVRKATPRKAPWTLAELLPTVPAPLTNTSEWKVSASHNAAAAVNVLGAIPGARWDTGAPQQPGMWFQIELPQAATIAELQIDSIVQGAGGRGRGGRGGGPPAGGPVEYSVQVSMDGTTWPPPVAQGPGSTPKTTISFDRVQARYIRINQTGTSQNGQAWGIQQVRVLGVGGAK